MESMQWKVVLCCLLALVMGEWVGGGALVAFDCSPPNCGLNNRMLGVVSGGLCV